MPHRFWIIINFPAIRNNLLIADSVITHVCQVRRRNAPYAAIVKKRLCAQKSLYLRWTCHLVKFTVSILFVLESNVNDNTPFLYFIGRRFWPNWSSMTFWVNPKLLLRNRQKRVKLHIFAITLKPKPKRGCKGHNLMRAKARWIRNINACTPD